MKRLFALLLAALLLLSACGPKNGGEPLGDDTTERGVGLFDETEPDESVGETAEVTDIGFEHVKEDIETTVQVICTEGTPNAYKLENGTLTFSGLTADSIYTLKGDLGGHIVIDAGNYKFELVLEGVIIQSSTDSPIVVTEGNKFTLTAKKDTANFIYDLREAVDSSAEDVYSGSVHVECDMQIGGKGSLTVESQNNNGIHTKDDLEVKNLKLTVTCIDNALKGNDSVMVESGEIVLISRAGDGIKTSNSDVSDKGNQRGNISIIGGKVDIYAACDGLDASHDAIIEGDAALNIYTDKYSDYSEEITATSESAYYIRFNLNNYNFSIKYTNDAGESVWKTAKLKSEPQAGGGAPGGTPPDGMPGGSRPGGSGRPGQPSSSSAYYIYEIDKPAGYSKMQLFIYSSGQAIEQETDYAAASEQMSINDNYDMIVLEATNGSLRMNWSNYSTSSQQGGFGGGFPGGGMGPGGFGEGNSDKSDHSTKGIKAGNEIKIAGGSIFIKSYDDSIHANADTALENGKSPTGNVTLSGGTLVLYSNDDGVHADGKLTVSGGDITITNSYEGLEGTSVLLSGGQVALISKDDGINATASSGTGVEIKGGELYIFASGDGIDANSRSSYQGIVFGGGKTIVISTSGGNSAIDTEQGYSYTGGYVLALMPSGGMSSESKHCQNFNSVAQSGSVRVNQGEYLTVGDILTVRMPTSLNALAIFIGDKNAKMSTSSSTSAKVDENGVCWH